MISVFGANLFIVSGAVLQTSAMLFQNQIVLRTMFILGAACYVTYYLHVLPKPLWEAAAASIAMATTTGIGLISFLIGRSEFVIPKHLIGLYYQMGNVQPGEFRSLLSCGTRRILDQEETLTVQEQTPKKLYFIESGDVEAVKNDYTFPLPTGIFIGEIAFMTGAPASATVRVAAGGRIVEWDSERLHKQIRRRTKLRLALAARLAQDLAGKVANSVVSSHGGATRTGTDR